MFEAYKKYFENNKQKLEERDPVYVKAYLISTVLFTIAFILFLAAGVIHLVGGIHSGGLAAGIGDFIHTLLEHAAP